MWKLFLPLALCSCVFGGTPASNADFTLIPDNGPHNFSISSGATEMYFVYEATGADPTQYELVVKLTTDRGTEMIVQPCVPPDGLNDANDRNIIELERPGTDNDNNCPTADSTPGDMCIYRIQSCLDAGQENFVVWFIYLEFTEGGAQDITLEVDEAVIIPTTVSFIAGKGTATDVTLAPGGVELFQLNGVGANSVVGFWAAPLDNSSADFEVSFYLADRPTLICDRSCRIRDHLDYCWDGYSPGCGVDGTSSTYYVGMRQDENAAGPVVIERVEFEVLSPTPSALSPGVQSGLVTSSGGERVYFTVIPPIAPNNKKITTRIDVLNATTIDTFVEVYTLPVYSGQPEVFATDSCNEDNFGCKFDDGQCEGDFDTCGGDGQPDSYSIMAIVSEEDNIGGSVLFADYRITVFFDAIDGDGTINTVASFPSTFSEVIADVDTDVPRYRIPRALVNSTTDDIMEIVVSVESTYGGADLDGHWTVVEAGDRDCSIQDDTFTSGQGDAFWIIDCEFGSGDIFFNFETLPTTGSINVTIDVIQAQEIGPVAQSFTWKGGPNWPQYFFISESDSGFAHYSLDVNAASFDNVTATYVPNEGGSGCRTTGDYDTEQAGDCTTSCSFNSRTEDNGNLRTPRCTDGNLFRSFWVLRNPTDPTPDGQSFQAASTDDTSAIATISCSGGTCTSLPLMTADGSKAWALFSTDSQGAGWQGSIVADITNIMADDRIDFAITQAMEPTGDLFGCTRKRENNCRNGGPQCADGFIYVEEFSEGQYLIEIEDDDTGPGTSGANATVTVTLALDNCDTVDPSGLYCETSLDTTTEYFNGLSDFVGRDGDAEYTFNAFSLVPSAATGMCLTDMQEFFCDIAFQNCDDDGFVNAEQLCNECVAFSEECSFLGECIVDACTNLLGINCNDVLQSEDSPASRLIMMCPAFL